MEKAAVRASVHAVVEFALRAGDLVPGASAERLLEGVRGHRSLQSVEAEGVRNEVPVRLSLEGEAVSLTVFGRIDRLHGLRRVEEIKTTLDGAPEEAAPLHWAQAECYAHMLCQAEDLPLLEVCVTYLSLSDGEITRFVRTRTRAELAEVFAGYVRPYLAWLDGQALHRAALAGEMRALRFPFPRYRAGQRELAQEIFLAIRDKRMVLAQAPTGTGKTLAALFPALKGIGEGLVERIFYLTARTTARQAAVDALRLLPQGSLRSVVLYAREKICPQSAAGGDLPPDCRPEVCPRARGYFDRLPAALDAARRAAGTLDREGLCRLAEAHGLCPFELSLDIALESDVVICDYNYLFDPRVRLQRFASGGRRGQVLLLDEAHNLPDRGRAMYSARLAAREIDAVRASIPRGQRRGTLYPALKALLGALGASFCAGDVPRAEAAPQEAILAACEEALCALRQDPVAEGAAANRLALDLAAFLYQAAHAGPEYAWLFEGGKTTRTLTLFCTDASGEMGKVLRRSRAAVLFSATLTPLPFYRALCGAAEGSPCVALRSPFPPENLLVLHLPVDTRYRARERTLPRVVSAIAALVRSRERGNFIAFFPSHAYLRSALPLLAGLLEGEAELLAQEEDMDESARQAFLSRFSPEPGGRLLALCAMGGIFSEGVDLPAERLCGAAIVGVGLPQVGLERETLRARYETSYGDGYAFAYLYPGIGRVLQAAGRIIRSETDRGALLLLDDRYGSAVYRDLLPPEWTIRRVRRDEEIRVLCATFFGA
ncbi:MAG: ATP-dependent DNA helicase [Candidatus Spyradocola sp.]